MADLERRGRIGNIKHRKTLAQTDQRIFAFGVEVLEAPDVVGARWSCGHVGECDAREQVNLVAGMRIRRSVCAANRSAARPARVVGLDRPAVISIKRLGIRHDFEPEAAQLVSKRSRHTGDDGFAASRHSGPEVIEAIVSAARANGTAEQSEDIFDVVDGIDPGRYANLATFASLGQRVADAATRAYRQSGNRRCPDPVRLHIREQGRHAFALFAAATAATTLATPSDRATSLALRPPIDTTQAIRHASNRSLTGQLYA